MDEVAQYVRDNATAFEDKLCELLRIASVSADSKYHGEVRRAASWVAELFQSMGLSTETIDTIGQPLIYAEPPPVPGKPTVLVDNRIICQPATPAKAI